MSPIGSDLSLLRPYVLGLATALAVAGCSGSTTDTTAPEALPDWSDGFDPTTGGTTPTTDTTGTNYVPPPNEMSVAINDEVTWPHRLRKLDFATGQPIDAPCSIPLDGLVAGQNSTHVDCVLDANEADLFIVGMEFDVTVPGGVCDLVPLPFYFYERWRIGDGPLNVSWTEDAFGNVSNLVNALEIDGAVVPQCQYDYEGIGGPNCCTGLYTVTVTKPDGKTIYTRGWGGEDAIGECYAGGAFLDAEKELASNGMPITQVVYTNKARYEHTFLFNDPATDQDRGYLSNLGLSNYYVESDHDGGTPGALARGWPTYNVICADDAFEEYASISLYVRDWNTEDEFAKDGNPDVVDLPQGNGYLDPPADDFGDWKSLAPGADGMLNGQP